MIAGWVRRWVGYTLQIREDFAWHRRFGGSDMPSLLKRVAEQASLLVSNGIDGEDYYTHGLFRPGISKITKREFLGYYGRARYFGTLNPPIYDVLARDKVVFHMLATSMGLPVPEIVAVTSGAGQPAFGRKLVNLQMLSDFLMEPDSQDIFLKPGSGHYGEGALSLGEKVVGSEEWRRLPGHEPICQAEVLEHVQRGGRLRRFLIQKRLRPHPMLAEIVPEVCSTIRFMTYVRESPVMLGAVLRLGNGSGPTDNLTGGGVVVSIDLDSGQLGDVFSIESGIPERMSKHPVTGVEITGKYIPGWAEVVEMVRVAAAKFSFLPCIGWDVAITDHGPVIIEINTRPRCRSIQVANDKGVLVGAFREALAGQCRESRTGLRLQ